MDWERYEALVRGVLPEVAPDTPLHRDFDLIGHGLNSFRMLSLVRAMEQEFDVELPDEALRMDAFRTMGTAWDMLRQLPAADRW